MSTDEYVIELTDIAEDETTNLDLDIVKEDDVVEYDLDDNDFSLKKYGLQGKIVYTPGHTYGSISVILDSGEAFVGCLAHNRLPFGFRPKLPIYAKDLDLLKESWIKVINKGAATIYPGHGKSFPVDKITKYLN